MTLRHVVKLYIKTRLHSGLLESDSHLGIIYDMNLIICHATFFFFFPQGSEWTTFNNQSNLWPWM